MDRVLFEDMIVLVYFNTFFFLVFFWLFVCFWLEQIEFESQPDRPIPITMYTNNELWWLWIQIRTFVRQRMHTESYESTIGCPLFNQIILNLAQFLESINWLQPSSHQAISTVRAIEFYLLSDQHIPFRPRTTWISWPKRSYRFSALASRFKYNI